jgi:hypothetical protein
MPARTKSAKLPRPPKSRRWTSFVADETYKGRLARGLHEEKNPRHRLRVEHTDHTLLVHLSGEGPGGWITLAVDRATRRFAVGTGERQIDAAVTAFEVLYGSK